MGCDHVLRHQGWCSRPFEDDEASHVQMGVLTIVVFYKFLPIIGEKVAAFVNRKGEWLEDGEDDEEELSRAGATS